MQDQRFAEIFERVARLGSLRRAAAHLDLDPSVVSRTIRNAEAAFGVKLLDRHPQGIVLTDAGRLTFDHVSQQLADTRRFQARLARLSAFNDQPVRIRCGAGFLMDLIEHGLPAMRADATPAHLSVEVGSTGTIVEAVASGLCDIGIAYDIPNDPNLQALSSRDQPLRVVAPVDPVGAVTFDKAVDLAAIAALPMALLPEGYGVRELLERSARRNGFVLRPILTCNSIAGLVHFVRCGHGITFLPESSVAGLLRERSVRTAALTNPTLNAPTATLFVRARRRLTASVERVADVLCERMHSFGDRLGPPARPAGPGRPDQPVR